MIINLQGIYFHKLLVSLAKPSCPKSSTKIAHVMSHGENNMFMSVDRNDIIDAHRYNDN